MSIKSKNIYKQIYKVVSQIPCGKVATYGQVAELAGIPGQARQVGYALNALNDTNIPWQRVINARGKISKRANSDFEKFQKVLLENEGIVFDKNNIISSEQYLWHPKHVNINNK